MSNGELKDWFYNLLNNCYPVIYYDFGDTIFWYYDDSYVRKCKLNKINNEEITLPSKVVGKCLFAQRLDFNHININNDIWKVLQYNSSMDYFKIKKTFKELFYDRFEIARMLDDDYPFLEYTQSLSVYDVDWKRFSKTSYNTIDRMIIHMDVYNKKE